MMAHQEAPKFQPVQVIETVPSEEELIEHQRMAKAKTMEASGNGSTVLSRLLVDRFGEQCIGTRSAEFQRHRADLSLATPTAPNIIFYPEDTHQIAWMLEQVTRLGGISVVPYGKGTSTEGQTVQTTEGTTVSLDMHRMRRILAFNRTDMTVRLEAGLDLLALNEALKEDGLWFPVDPMANATIGGMAGSNVEGLSALKYGKLAGNVLGLKIILADGTVVEVSHYNPLLQIFIGSEGTLGVIAEATLRLRPIQGPLKTVLISFSRLEEAALAIPRILKEQAGLCRCFLLDGPSLSKLRWAKQCPSLLLQVDQDEAFLDFPDSIERNESMGDYLWHHLSAIWFYGSDPVSTTVNVPPSRIAELVREFHQGGSSGQEGCIFGNAGMGTITFIRPAGKVEAFRQELFPLVLRLGGSVTGYGMGSCSRAWAKQELGLASSDLWTKIKTLLDPQNILNPSKIIM